MIKMKNQRENMHIQRGRRENNMRKSEQVGRIVVLV
jgi:hypothetical protein